jgi:hypothetical protein
VDGVFQPGEKESAILEKQFAELHNLAGFLTPARASLT